MARALGIVLALALVSCATSTPIFNTTMGDAWICKGKSTYDAGDGSMICEGEWVWTGHVSEQFSGMVPELGGEIADKLAGHVSPNFDEIVKRLTDMEGRCAPASPSP